MSSQATIQPQTPVDAAVEPPDAVEVPLEEGSTTEATVTVHDGPAVTVSQQGTDVTATAQPAPVTDAQVTAPHAVEAQVVTSGFITIVQEVGGDAGFVEWAEYDYQDVGINLVKVLEAGNVVTEIKLIVLEAFDGTPTIELGSAADHDLWLSLGTLELGQLCEYHTEQLTPFSVPERINLTMAAPGSTQGRVGLLYRVVL